MSNYDVIVIGGGATAPAHSSSPIRRRPNKVPSPG
jgi:hypothetical protein